MSQYEGKDAEFQAVAAGRPFKKCKCGSPIPGGEKACNECKRLEELGFHGKPSTIEDTNEVQSYPSDHDHSGYSDSIPSNKINRERV